MATILLVDDCTLVSRPLCLLLEQAGHRVTCLTDLSAALPALRADPAHLILLEVALRLSDGLALLPALRADPDPRVAATPVVIWTFVGDDDSADRAAAAGADGFIVKGLPFEALLARLEPFLGPPAPPDRGDVQPRPPDVAARPPPTPGTGPGETIAPRRA
jgi:DNA-binding response OmpR family regulator